MSEIEETRVVLIGAGPIGIEMAVALQRHGVPYVHYEAGQIGWTISWYAPETTFFSSPERISLSGIPLEAWGQRKASREQYLHYLRGVVRQFGLPVRSFRRATGIRKLGARENFEACFEVASERSYAGVGGPRDAKVREPESEHETEVIRAQYVVCAVGDMHRPRMLDVPGEDLPHVSHYLSDPHEYFGRRVLIVGGRNSAAEAALRLYRAGAQVALSYREYLLPRGHIKYWILPELEGLMREGRIGWYGETVPVEITRNEVILSQTVPGPGEPLHVPADAVLLLTGYEQDPSLYHLAGIQLEGEGNRPVYDPETMETNVEGLFVAGTGSAGTQVGGYREFIETSHVHVDRIVSRILGRKTEGSVPELRSDELLET